MEGIEDRINKPIGKNAIRKKDFEKYIEVLGNREEYFIFGGRPEWIEKSMKYGIPQSSPFKTTLKVKKSELFTTLKNMQAKKWSVWVSLNEKEEDKIEGVTAIHVIWFDFDAPREIKGKPATKEEREKALEEAKKFKEFMSKKYGAIGFLACSGNGYHLFYPVKRFELLGKNFRKEFNKKQGAWMRKLKEEAHVNFDTTTDIRRVSQPIGFPNVKIPDTPLPTYWVDEFTKEDIEKAREKNQILIEEILNTELEKERPAIEGPAIPHPKIEELMKKDEKLRDLYNGEWKKYGYPSRSEGEQALVNRLVCYGFTDEEIKEIMKTSKIGKWQEKKESYWNLTIEKAKKWKQDGKCFTKRGIDENVELLRITPIKHSKNGKYYYAVKISDEDVEKVKVEVLENGEIRISEVMDIWFAYPVRIYKAIYDSNTRKWYYDIQIDKERELLSQNDVVKKLSGKGSGLNEYKIKEALGKILHGMKIEGKYHEIKAKYQAVGVYLNEDETFKLAISMEDGVFPSTSHNAKVYQDLILKKGIPNDEEMKKTFDFILQILTLVDNPIERINTILLYGWGMIAPFHYIFRLKGLMGYYFVSYGVHNTGKTLRAYILNAGYGGMKGPTSESFESTFRLGVWAEISTFPVLLNDLTKISKKVVSQIKSGAEETEIVERGLPNQSMRIYKSLSSFFITCQDIDWLTSNNEKEALAVMDRFIVGLEETKPKTANLPAIVYEGVRYSGESLKTKAKELPAWAIRIIKDVIEDLNTEDKNTGLKGYPKFEVILSNLIEGIKAKLNEMGILEDLSTRDLEKLAKIYMGIAILIEEIKRYYPEWQKYEKAKWFFDMQDLTKFVYFLGKNWLGMVSLSDTLEQYILDIYEAYNYRYAYKHDQYTKNRDLLSRTGYNFRNDIIIDEDDKTIFLTQSYIRIAKNKFTKRGYGAYNTLSSLAKDLAKALGKDYKEIYKVMPYELNGARPRVIVLSIDDILNYLSSGAGGED